MILVILVVFGVSIFCLVNGYFLVAAICLVGVSKKLGWPALIFTSLFLFAKGHWMVGLLPPLLILWNVVGLLFSRGSPLRGAWPHRTIEDLGPNFYEYCMSYLVERRNIPEKDSRLALWDPALFGRMRAAQNVWASKDLGPAADAERFLEGKPFESPEMRRINAILDEYANSYSEREERSDRG